MIIARNGRGKRIDVVRNDRGKRSGTTQIGGRRAKGEFDSVENVSEEALCKEPA